MKFLELLKTIYEEKYEEKKENETLKASYAEIILFYLTLLILLFTIMVVNVFCPKSTFSPKHAILIIPGFLWGFMRASRKDMSATAYLIAGLFGALGGVIVSHLVK